MEERLASGSRFGVRQVKEWGEVLTDFETRNRYEILADDGTPIGLAAEEGGGIGRFLMRSFLRAARPTTLHLLDSEGRQLGRGDKKFRLYFYAMEVEWGGKKIGAIERRFSLLHRKFTVSDSYGREVVTIHSPLLKIWTFELRRDDRKIGAIRKQWGGMLKEAFTQADTFGVEFEDPGLDPELKQLLLVATFLIDFTCFEKGG